MSMVRSYSWCESLYSKPLHRVWLVNFFDHVLEMSRPLPGGISCEHTAASGMELQYQFKPIGIIKL